MTMGQMQKALVGAGLVKEPKERKRQGKQFKCHKCGAPMVKIANTNVMVCSQEDKEHTSFYIFNPKK